MKEAKINMMTLIGTECGLCITTNCIITSKNRAVMGGGVAALAKEAFPGIDHALAVALRTSGNVPAMLGGSNRHGDFEYGNAAVKSSKTLVFSFPTKYDYRDPSRPELIERSAVLISELITALGTPKQIYLPRPGCGLGGLEWDFVKKIISPILDDRFTIISN